VIDLEEVIEQEIVVGDEFGIMSVSVPQAMPSSAPA
jgi:hypothetical protein